MHVRRRRLRASTSRSSERRNPSRSPRPQPSLRRSSCCPHPDCAQPNAAGHERCVYCNRPLHAQRHAARRRAPAAGSAARALSRASRRFRPRAAKRTSCSSSTCVAATRSSPSSIARASGPTSASSTILAQAVGDDGRARARHGVSDGAAYEILEYVPGGTLEALMAGGPLPKDDIRAHRARDRGRARRHPRAPHPASRPQAGERARAQRTAAALALTDFGIASLSDATQHFTSAARTTKYAAPEVLTGVLDDKSDWWSLGMIVLEAASGRHPFDGLSEQVMNHQLATRPIDVRGVYDDDAARPVPRPAAARSAAALRRRRKLRAGSPAIRRSQAPEERRGDQRGEPYRIGKTEATTRARARRSRWPGTGTTRSATSRAATSRAGSRTSCTTTTCCARCRTSRTREASATTASCCGSCSRLRPTCHRSGRAGRSRRIR